MTARGLSLADLAANVAARREMVEVSRSLLNAARCMYEQAPPGLERARLVAEIHRHRERLAASMALLAEAEAVYDGLRRLSSHAISGAATAKAKSTLAPLTVTATATVATTATATATVRRTRKPPGSTLAAIARRACTTDVYEATFEPIYADLCHEHRLAVGAGRTWRARWMRLEAVRAFAGATFAHAALQLWRRVRRLAGG